MLPWPIQVIDRRPTDSQHLWRPLEGFRLKVIVRSSPCPLHFFKYRAWPIHDWWNSSITESSTKVRPHENDNRQTTRGIDRQRSPSAQHHGVSRLGSPSGSGRAL